MAKAILRIEKLKKTSVGACGAHNHRLRDTLNADPAKVSMNAVYVGSSDLSNDVTTRLKVLGDKVIRKDATVAVEMLLTASPEFFLTASQDKQNLWVQKNLAFLKERYGVNLVNAVIHRDEKTPHIHAVIVPITPDGRLNCKSVFGEKKELSQLQSDYANAMRGCGLERGIEKSFASHKDVKSFYSELKQAISDNQGEVKPAVPELVKAETNILGLSNQQQVEDCVRKNRNLFFRANKPFFQARKAEKVLATELKQTKDKNENLEKRISTLSIELEAVKKDAQNWQKVPFEIKARVIDPDFFKPASNERQNHQRGVGR